MPASKSLLIGRQCCNSGFKETRVAILVLKKLDKPVDIVYIALLAFYLTIYKNDYNFLALIPMIVQVLVTKKEKISFMISIELAYTILMTLRMIGEFS